MVCFSFRQPHRKAVIMPVVIGLQLIGKVLKKNKTGGSYKTARCPFCGCVLFCLGVKEGNQIVTDALLVQNPLKQDGALFS